MRGSRSGPPPSVVGALTLALGLSGSAYAQLLRSAPTESPAPTPAVEVTPDSPRTSLAEYLQLCRAGRYAQAARFLDLSPQQEANGAVYARKLKAVLDRHLWLDLSKVSSQPGGNRDDGLPPDVDELGTIPSPSGKLEPVRLVRREDGANVTWVFSRPTVARIDGWYAALEDRFLLDVIPEPLQRPGPREILWWQWIAILALSPLLWLGGRGLGWLTRKLLLRIARRTRTEWDDEVVLRLRGPLVLPWALLLAWIGIRLLGLYEPAEAFLVQVLRAGAIVAVFWILLRVIQVGGEVAARTEWARTNPSAPSLLSVGVRTGEVLLFVVGALASLSTLGIPVGSIVAGLGIGGIAVALASQKTMENFFGSISIGIDQPLRVGDFVRIGEVVGTVEQLGLRSTRVRTLDRTLVTLPNGKLADTQIETFAARDRIRLACTLALQYGTTAAQLRRIVEGITRLLQDHPRTWKEVIAVNFTAFADSSLNVEVMVWFETRDFAEFRDLRQEVLFGFMEVVEREGSGFAFPTRTVHVVGPSAPDGLPAPAARG